MSSFAMIADSVVEKLLHADVLAAADAGDHRFDGDLPDWSRGGVARQLTMLEAARRELAAVVPDHLTADEAVDLMMLRDRVDRGVFEVTELREFEWNPLVHNPGALLHALLVQSSQPVDQRLTHLRSRLEALPDALATARAIIEDPPLAHLSTAREQFAGTVSLLRHEVPRLLDAEPGQSGPVRTAVSRAIAALGEFDEWLGHLQSNTDPRRSPRLGAVLWQAKLRHTLGTDRSAEPLLASAWAELDLITDQIRDVAAAMTGQDPSDATVRHALALCAERRSDNSTVLTAARRSLADASRFVEDHDLVSLIGGDCVVKVMPSYARGGSVAYCDAPGPLETGGDPTLYCISPALDDWEQAAVTSFYREYNNFMIGNLTVHEAMPGHFLQLQHARRYRGTSRARALCMSEVFLEGWAVYAEEMMASRGFGGLPVRLQQLKMRMRTILNAIVDQLTHCHELPGAEVMALLVHRGFQENSEASGKWQRALLTSTQLSTYFVGYTEVREIVDMRPHGMPLRAWHDAMLAYGSPAPRYLRQLLFQDVPAL